MFPRINFLASMVLLLLAAGDISAETTHAIDFNRDVRSILANKCFQCHGPDEGQRQADLRLDSANGAFSDRGAYAAIVRGDPNASELVRRITAGDSDQRMPPADTGKTLDSEEVELLI